MSDQRLTSPTPTETPDGPTQTTEPTTEPVVNGAEGPGSILDPATEPEEAAFDEGKLKLPEGFDKGEGWDDFKNIAAKLPHNAAQKLIELAEKSVNAQTQRLYQQWHEQQVNWQKEIKADPELGGANLEGMKQSIGKLLDNPELSDPKLREALLFTGAGNHPAIVRSLFRYARVLTEGGSLPGGPPARDNQGSLANQPRNIAQSMYGPDGPHTGGPKI